MENNIGIHTRTGIINSIIQAFHYNSYLEIGVGNGWHYENVCVPHKQCVDPGGAENQWGGQVTYKMTSDEFFEKNPNKNYDLIFIDGLHHAENVERDIRNSLNSLHPNGMVICHDMNPTTELMQRVPRESIEWTGDCWRAWLRFRNAYPNLLMFVLDTDYGVGVIYPHDRMPLVPMLDADMTFDEFNGRKHELLPLVGVNELWDRLGRVNIS